MNDKAWAERRDGREKGRGCRVKDSACKSNEFQLPHIKYYAKRARKQVHAVYHNEYHTEELSTALVD